MSTSEEEPKSLEDKANSESDNKPHTLTTAAECEAGHDGSVDINESSGHTELSAAVAIASPGPLPSPVFNEESDKSSDKLEDTEDSPGATAIDPAKDESTLPPQAALSSGDGHDVATDSSHVFNESWSKLPKDVIVDKVKGVIYGQAIGDAFGLATEFLVAKEAKRYYKQGPKGYDDIIPDMHRQRWKKGDWTDDTDQMLCILQMIVEKRGRVDVLNFASRLHTWMTQGFKELGDIGGMGIGMTTKKTLTNPEFLKDPQGCAKQVWEESGKYLAANGAIMRTSILGTLSFNDISKVATNTAEIAKVTHADPRSIASCIAVTTAIAMILKGDYDPSKREGLKKLVEAALKEAEKVLEDKDHKKELREHAAYSLDKLKLSEPNKIGYTYKAFGAGFYGLRKSRKKRFRDIILKVIMEAGDADSNGAVCGALTGCVVGFKALPEDLLQFPHRDWLDQQVDNFLTTVGLKE